MKQKENQDAKENENKNRRPKPFIFIIMAYLLTIGSRGRHKALCRPKNANKTKPTRT